MSNTVITSTDAASGVIRVHAQGSLPLPIKIIAEDGVTQNDISGKTFRFKVDGLKATGGEDAPINKLLVADPNDELGLLLKLTATDLANMPLNTAKKFLLVDVTDADMPDIVWSGTIQTFGHKTTDGTDE